MSAGETMSHRMTATAPCRPADAHSATWPLPDWYSAPKRSPAGKRGGPHQGMIGAKPAPGPYRRQPGHHRSLSRFGETSHQPQHEEDRRSLRPAERRPQARRRPPRTAGHRPQPPGAGPADPTASLPGTSSRFERRGGRPRPAAPPPPRPPGPASRRMSSVSGSRKKVSAVRARTGGQKRADGAVGRSGGSRLDGLTAGLVSLSASSAPSARPPLNTTASTTNATTPGTTLQPMTLRTSAPRLQEVPCCERAEDGAEVVGSPVKSVCPSPERRGVISAIRASRGGVRMPLPSRSMTRKPMTCQASTGPRNQGADQDGGGVAPRESGAAASPGGRPGGR